MSNHDWTLLSNHGHVLVCIARDPDIRIRDVAAAVGLTDRAVHGIITDLVEAGFVEKARFGRRNHYSVHPEAPLRHPIEKDHHVGELLDPIVDLSGTALST